VYEFLAGKQPFVVISASCAVLVHRLGRPVEHGPEVVQRAQNLFCQRPERYSRWSVRTLRRLLGLPGSTMHQMLATSTENTKLMQLVSISV
jgi:hypothetical protein